MPQTTIFSQIIKEIPRSEFERYVAKHNGDKGVRALNCWTWFGSLLFSQLTGHDSIRALEKVFAHGDKEMKRLGLSAVCRSTLSDANSSRPLEILENVYEYVLAKVQCLPRKNGFDFSGKVLALDSTFISLCLSLCPWAKSGGSKGCHRSYAEYAGIKIHTAIDIAGDLPEFVCIKTGREAMNNDAKVARELFRPAVGTTVIMDRAYCGFSYFKELQESGCYFVTRLSNGAIFKTAKSRIVDRTQGLICDQEVYATGKQSKKNFSGRLRRIVYKDPITKKRFVFITNRFDLEAKVICDLYKARWRIEIFFKTLKQHLRVKKFLGLSEHAVKAQILVALIAYLLISFVKLTHRSSVSMTEIAAAIMTLLLLKLPLKSLLEKFPRTKRHPPPIQFAFKF